MTLRARRIEILPPEPAGPHSRVRVLIDGDPHATFFGEDDDTAVAVAESYGFFKVDPVLVITRITNFLLPEQRRHGAIVHPEWTDHMEHAQAVFYAPTEEQAVAMAEAWIEGHA